MAFNPKVLKVADGSIQRGGSDREARLRAAVLYLPGGMATTAVMPIEILRSVGAFWNELNDLPPEPCFDVMTVSEDGKPVQVREFKTLHPAHSFTELGCPDVVVVPSAGFDSSPPFDMETVVKQSIERNASVLPWLRKWWDDGTHIVGIGAGVGLMAAAGILDGKQATTHWGFIDIYKSLFPKVDWRSEFTVTSSGRTYCGAGTTVGAQVLLVMIEKLCGPEIAMQTAMAHLLDVPKMRQVGEGQGALLDSREDATIMRAEAWLNSHVADEVNFADIAVTLGMSQRNFARRFKLATGESPLAYLQRLRIGTARKLLEEKRLTIQEIAERVGYNDIVHFRTLFKRVTGTTPAAYRDRYMKAGENAA